MYTITIKRRIFAILLAALSGLLVMSFSGTTTAVGEGQIAGGDIYRVKNVTKGGAFMDPAGAAKCETVQYKIRLHNPGPGEVTNVNVRVNFPAGATTQHTSTATITAQNSQPASVSDTATLNLSSSLAVSYISGSTQLLDTHSNVISSLPDGITGSGVNIGKVGVSLKEIKFVQFKAKTECKETPPPPKPEKEFKCEALNATRISRTEYKFTAVAHVKNVTIQNYVFTARNSSNQTVDTKTVTTSQTQADYTFKEERPGTYTVFVIINTNKGATKPGECVKQIKIVEKNKVPPPPVTPEGPPPEVPPEPTPEAPRPPEVVPTGAAAPEVLPETGPADTVTTVALVAVTSSTVYYVASRRISWL